MTYKDFVSATMSNLSQEIFNELKRMMLGEYICFSIIDPEDVTIDILAEKICDYFVTLEIKTGKSFDKHIKSYMNDLDSIVESHIAKTPKAKKGDTTPVVVPRSRRYYEKAIATKNVKKLSITQLIDYSRIMMCLYTAVLKNEGKPIENFDYAADCLVPKNIIESIKNDEISIVFPPSKKKRFDTKESYSEDVCSLIIFTLILCWIVNRREEGEVDHE